MRILHLMKKEKFTKTVAEFYDVHFNNGEHEICYINNGDNNSMINSNLTIKQSEYYIKHGYSKEALKLMKELEKCDYIVMHSLIFSNYWFIFNRKLCKKLIWVAWGYDLYNWKYDKFSISSRIGMLLRNSCHTFIGIFPPDCEYFRKSFPKSKANIVYAPYTGAYSSKKLSNYKTTSRLQKTNETSDTVYIQIGHSAVKSVNHIRVLNSIKHMSCENIKILLPLSYGDMEYAKQTREYADKYFPGKVICLTDMLPIDEYYKLIERVDIAIFDTERQIALGNINQMIFNNVKIYLSTTGVMYNYFFSHGIPVQDCSELSNISFEDFIKPVNSHDEREKNQYIRNICDIDYKVELWRKIYEGLRKNNG